MNISIKTLCIGGLLWLLAGCAGLRSHKEQFADVDRQIAAQQYSSAVSLLEASKDRCYEKKDRVLYYLDLGMLYHYAGNARRSNECLTNAEEAIDELYTKSISKAAASLLLNDNVLDYSGETYEDIYLNVFKALNYLQQNQYDEAYVEIRRIDNKLATLEDRYGKIAEEYNSVGDAHKKFSVAKIQFHNSALGRYLSALMYRAEGKDDDAQLDLEKFDEAWHSQSQIYNFPEPECEEYFQESEKAKIDFFSFVGKSPQLFARTLTIHTFKDAIAIYTSNGKNEQQLEMIPWPKMTDGYHFKFALPYMEKFGSKVARISVEIDHGPAVDLQTLESLENVTEDTYKMKEKIVYIKTIIRTIVKGIANEKANVELDKKTGGGWMGELTRAATSAAVDVSEQADLRLSRYFPAKVLIGEAEVNPGNHHITLKYYDANGLLLYIDEKDINVAQTGLNLVQSFYLR